MESSSIYYIERRRFVLSLCCRRSLEFSAIIPKLPDLHWNRSSWCSIPREMESAAAAAATGIGSSCSLYRGYGRRHGVLMVQRRPGVLSFDSRCRGLLKQCPLMPLLKQGQWRQEIRIRRNYVIRASSSPSEPAEFSSSIAPLKLESPIGQFLLQILTSHPHLLPAAVERQLQQLKTDRDAEKNQEEPPTPSTDLVLYRRIAEVKTNERNRALEEILYALVVQKFMDADVSMVPAISQPSKSSDKVDHWPHEEDKLEGLHSREAYEMIKNHLRMILGPRLTDSTSVAPISKLRVGQVYAASVMYGYFLKRVDQRFQLEKNMKTLPWGSDEEETAIKQAMPDESRPISVANSHDIVSSTASPKSSTSGSGLGIKSSKLRSYVSSFDSETLQRYATVRSKEAFSIIEKHTEALFGRPEIVITPQGTIDSSKDELIKISFAGLRRLILEAVTFGSFLWEVEGYVDSRYHFVTN